MVHYVLPLWPSQQKGLGVAMLGYRDHKAEFLDWSAKAM